MKRDIRQYLEDILDSTNAILEICKDRTMAEVIGNRMFRDAILHNFHVIGEAAKNVPAQLKDKYPDIPWKDMAGMRDKLAHSYFSIDPDIIWKTIQERLPKLKSGMDRVLADIGN